MTAKEPKIVVRRLTPADIKREMGSYEEKYGMTSAEFEKRYFGGEFDGTADFVDWIGYCRMHRVDPRIGRTI